MPVTSPRPLTDNVIHLWMVNPKQIGASDALRALLSEQERDKVDRYRLPSAQHTALITRAFIRLLISQYAPLAPQQWQFSVSELGKPELANSPIALRFNLSHNDELLICALCLDKDIGCDIENLGRKISAHSIAKRFFSASEAQRIEAEPVRFFEYWTLKEAFVKATGLGISQGLDTFSFTINEADSAQFNDNINIAFTTQCQQQAPQAWYQALLFPDGQHCVALSINQQQGNKPAIETFSLQQGATLFAPYC